MDLASWTLLWDNMWYINPLQPGHKRLLIVHVHPRFRLQPVHYSVKRSPWQICEWFRMEDPLLAPPSQPAR